MRHLTQTQLDPGNCFQTVVACVLDLDPDRLPPQEQFDWYLEKKGDGPSYHSAIQQYLRQHHAAAYLEVNAELRPVVQLREPGIHFMSGRTIRSPSNGDKRHIVVARHGKVVWDPHPSRAGLIDDDVRWFILAPFPKHWEQTWDQFRKRCQCPECGGPERVKPPEAVYW